MQTTTQALKKVGMQKNYKDATFLARWLSGELTEKELSELDNREDYEEMMGKNKSTGQVPPLCPEPPSISAAIPKANVVAINQDESNIYYKIAAIGAFVLLATWLVLKLLSKA